MEHNIELRLLGSFSLSIGGKPVPPLRTRKGQWLLALLALRDGRAVERNWLAGMLWPDSLEEQSLCNLRRALTDLRSALGPAADRIGAPTPRTLSLDLQLNDVADIHKFNQLIEVGETQTLEQAAAIYRGFLLEGCVEHWVYQERRTTELAYLSAIEALAARYHDSSRFDDAIGLLRKVIAIEPLRETAHRQLMHSYAANGNLSSAVLVYREFREVVRRDLNSVPDKETTDLYLKIRAGVDNISVELTQQPVTTRQTSATDTAGRLPRPLSMLIGREYELIELRKALLDNRLVTLIGVGGIGKTRLAIQTAEGAIQQFSDGAWFADLSGIRTPELLASFVASSLDIPEDSAESPGERLTQHLVSKEILIVLDNCEHIVAGCAALAEGLLNACPRLKILATSRESLGINGEFRWIVPALSRPMEHSITNTQDALKELSTYDSIRLFVERGRGLQAEFSLTIQNANYIIEICNRLDGIPLAIELAAARLSVLTPEQIVLRLKDRFRLLTGGCRTAWPRHQTLQAMIDWSYDLLSDTERVLFRRLAVFNGGWNFDDLDCVGFGDSSDADLLDVFASLLEKSLVQADVESYGERRYRMLETIREFALEKLKEAGEWAAASRSHADYFLTVAQTANDGMLDVDRDTCIQRLLFETDNMRSALEWAIDTAGEAEKAAHLATALSRFWYSQCLYREGLKWLERILEFEKSIDRRVLCKVYNAAGSMYWVMAHFDSAQMYYERHMAICRELDDETGLAYALMNLGLVDMHRGEYPLARSRMEESIVLIRKHGDSKLLAAPLVNLAIVVKDMGEIDYAFRLVEESCALHQQVNNRRGMAAILILRGNLERRLGKTDEARASFIQALGHGNEPGDRQSCSIARHNLGDLSMHEGDFVAARKQYMECLTISQELVDRRQTATTMCSLGQLNRAEGNVAEYHRLYRESADLALEMKDRVLIVTLLSDLAGQAESTGDIHRVPVLAGAIDAAYERYGTPMNEMQKADLKRITASARRQLGEDLYCSAFREGQATSLEAALNASLSR